MRDKLMNNEMFIGFESLTSETITRLKGRLYILSDETGANG